MFLKRICFRSVASAHPCITTTYYFVLNCCETQIAPPPIAFCVVLFLMMSDSECVNHSWQWRAAWIPDNKAKELTSPNIEHWSRYWSVEHWLSCSQKTVGVFSCMGHDRGIGCVDVGGITMISHNRPHTCPCQSARTATARQGDFCKWLRFRLQPMRIFLTGGSGCSIVSVPPPYFPNPSPQ